MGALIKGISRNGILFKQSKVSNFAGIYVDGFFYIHTNLTMAKEFEKKNYEKKRMRFLII